MELFPSEDAAPSGQCRKIAAPTSGDERAQLLGGEYLDRVAPFVEMPGHLEPAAGIEAHDQPAIAILLHDLIGMEHVLPRHGCRPAVETPDHGAEFGIRVERTEGARRIALEIELGIAAITLRDMSVVSSRSRFLVNTVGLRPGAPPVQG